MNAVTEFDVGPLTWVKGEIDLALARAAASLDRFGAGAAAGSADLTQIRFCRTHLHQVQGALTIVGLDGVTQFAEALEALLEAIEAGEKPADEASIALVREALSAIGLYLAGLIDGQPNRPLRLLPLYGKLRAARGNARWSAVDLFFPDLSVRPPCPGTPARNLSEIERTRRLRRERGRFERGLLSWLRAPKDKDGVREMLAAVRGIEEMQDTGNARAFWWVAGGFLAALAEDGVRDEASVKPLCARIDLQIRRLLEGSRNVAEHLMRDVLYFVAGASSGDATVKRIKEAYRLDAFLPDAGDFAVPDMAQAAVVRLREVIAALEDAWNRFCAGSAASLSAFRENAGVFSRLAERTGHTDTRRLAQAIAAVAHWLTAAPSRHSEALAMELATAILLAQNARENYPRLGKDFAHQVDVIVERLHACIAGNPPRPGSEIPLLDEMSRQAQEKLLIGQVAKEIQNNLGEIEQGLDGFFRDAERRPELESLDKPARQIVGALTLLRRDGAAAAMQDCLEAIYRLAAPDHVPAEGEFEQLASRLSMLGFFVEAMPRGAADFEDFVRKMRTKHDGADSTEAGDAASVEEEVAERRRETHALLEALKAQPRDADLREEVRHSLKTLKSDAGLVADARLGDEAKAMLEVLASDADVAPQIERVMALLKPEAAGASPPSRETLQLSQASREEIDAELLGIFLEEAGEVLAAIGASLGELRRDAHDTASLTDIRRSFHTLKGSGRMVGLKDLGEAAWAVEQTLNLWLRLERAADPPLIELLDAAYGVFGEWVRHLETNEGTAPDPRDMIARAAALRSGAEAPQPLPALETPAAAEKAAPEPIPESAPVPAPDEPGAEPEAPRQRIAISPALFSIFSEEAKTYLYTLRRELPVLESQAVRPTPEEMCRASHTLAGISVTVGLLPINRLGLALERALLARDGSGNPGSAQALGVIRRAVGELESMFAAALEQRNVDVPSGLIEELDGLYPAAHGADEAGAASPAAAEAARESAPETETPESPREAPPDPEVAAPPPSQPPSAIAPVRDEIDAELLPIFLEEAVELTQAIAGQLRAWRAAPGDGGPGRVLARQLHTLKGSARMAGAMTLGEITHALEARVDEASRAGIASAGAIDEIESAFESIRQIIERLQRGETMEPADPEPRAAIGPEAAEARTTEEDERDRPLRPQDIPSTESEAVPTQATLRVKARVVDRLVNDAGELSIARSRIEGEMHGLKESLLDLTENVLRLRRQLREIEIQAEMQMQSRTAAISDEKHDGFDPLEFDRFTRFQELTRMMAESVSDVATIQQHLLKNLDGANAAIAAQARQNREVQQELLAMRMMPFDSLADRLYRVLRQASKDLGKRANLEIKGGQIELDRGVLDKIASPLEHMLRNAVAHGIEKRAERLARGKPEIGEILLCLKQEGNEIILTLSDDGAGLDYARIRERAVAAGLIGADGATDEASLAELIFVPGFSTAEALSQIAGRGVGMDVVKAEIAGLGGRIEIESAHGRGTQFRLILPLTLVVTKALLIRSGGQTFAVPSSMVEQVRELKAAELNRIREEGVARWRSDRYPFSYLPHLLGDRAALPEARRQYWVILLRSSMRRIAIQVDELLGNREIVVKNIGTQLARVIGIDGATVLGNGEVVLIINPVALAARAVSEHARADAPTPAAREGTQARPPTVMVVDDSLTVRKIVGRLLSREGYQVVSAKDGVDALEKLVDVVPDVMLLDIEMPRMDGFDLARHVRADARLKDVPIIMITSRTAEKHRNYAAEIGVNHYLGKPYQEEELLRLVAGFMAARRPA
jgi:chemosensory pili system protein ChpA (sensor histidine kinase/response regulator)